jgi:hypothetical protein
MGKVSRPPLDAAKDTIELFFLIERAALWVGLIGPGRIRRLR